MLAKKNRINRHQITEIFEKGKTLYSDNFSLKFFKKEGFLAGASFLCPKSVSLKAVQRNLLKRRARNVFKKFIFSLPQGWQGIFIFKKGSFSVFGGKKNKKYKPSALLEKEIKYLIEKAK